MVRETLGSVVRSLGIDGLKHDFQPTASGRLNAVASDGILPRMNPYDPPTTPPEPRRPRRLLTLMQWALIVFVAVGVVLVFMALMLIGMPGVR